MNNMERIWFQRTPAKIDGRDTRVRIWGGKTDCECSPVELFIIYCSINQVLNKPDCNTTDSVVLCILLKKKRKTEKRKKNKNA